MGLRARIWLACAVGLLGVAVALAASIAATLALTK